MSTTSRPSDSYARAVPMRVDLFTIVVDDYDEAIQFFVDALGFDLVEDSPARTNDGRVKRWVVVRPAGAETGILLAEADGDQQEAVVGAQTAGRVGFFLRVDAFDAAYERMAAAGHMPAAMIVLRVRRSGGAERQARGQDGDGGALQ